MDEKKKKQNTERPADVFAGEGSTAGRLKKKREEEKKRLDEIMSQMK